MQVVGVHRRVKRKKYTREPFKVPDAPDEPVWDREEIKQNVRSHAAHPFESEEELDAYIDQVLATDSVPEHVEQEADNLDWDYDPERKEAYEEGSTAGEQDDGETSTAELEAGFAGNDEYPALIINHPDKDPENHGFVYKGPWEQFDDARTVERDEAEYEQ